MFKNHITLLSAGAASILALYHRIITYGLVCETQVCNPIAATHPSFHEINQAIKYDVLNPNRYVPAINVTICYIYTLFIIAHLQSSSANHASMNAGLSLQKRIETRMTPHSKQAPETTRNLWVDSTKTCAKIATCEKNDWLMEIRRFQKQRIFLTVREP